MCLCVRAWVHVCVGVWAGCVRMGRIIIDGRGIELKRTRLRSGGSGLGGGLNKQRVLRQLRVLSGVLSHSVLSGPAVGLDLSIARRVPLERRALRRSWLHLQWPLQQICTTMCGPWHTTGQSSEMSSAYRVSSRVSAIVRGPLIRSPIRQLLGPIRFCSGCCCGRRNSARAGRASAGLRPVWLVTTPECCPVTL